MKNNIKDAVVALDMLKKIQIYCKLYGCCNCIFGDADGFCNTHWKVGADEWDLSKLEAKLDRMSKE